MSNGPLNPGDIYVGEGGNLKARNIIHTCVPMFGSERGQESKLMRNCYANAICQAEKMQCCNVAIPALAVGEYMYPIEESAKE